PPAGRFSISIRRTIASSSGVSGTCGIRARAAAPSPAPKQPVHKRPPGGGVWELIQSVAAPVISTGGAEPNARSHYLYSILCSHRTLRHRPPSRFFGHFYAAPAHRPICSLPRAASYRPIAPRRMAPPELSEAVCRVRREYMALRRRQHFVVV